MRKSLTFLSKCLRAQQNVLIFAVSFRKTYTKRLVRIM